MSYYGGADSQQIGEAVKLRDTTDDKSTRREANLIVHSGTDDVNKFTKEPNPYYDPTYSYDQNAQDFLDKNKK
jgi:hypothetical protein